MRFALTIESSHSRNTAHISEGLSIDAKGFQNLLSLFYRVIPLFFNCLFIQSRVFHSKLNSALSKDEAETSAICIEFNIALNYFHFQLLNCLLYHEVIDPFELQIFISLLSYISFVEIYMLHSLF